MIKKSEKINLLLVDDQYLFLESLKIVIDSIADDMCVVGTAKNGEQALSCLESILNTEKKSVSAVLMDVRMPVMDGVTASRIIHEKYPDIYIIMLTTFEDDEYVRDAVRNGATGYLLKNIAPKMLVSAVRAVCDGSFLIDPNIAGSLVQNIVATGARGEKILDERLPDWFYELSGKERGIIKHMLQGLSNKEVAFEMHIGEQTVRNYISAIYSKLEVPDRRSLLDKIRKIQSSYFY